MEIKEMSIYRLEREKISLKRQIKTLNSTIKQIDDELEKRFDKGELTNGTDREIKEEEIN